MWMKLCNTICYSYYLWFCREWYINLIKVCRFPPWDKKKIKKSNCNFSFSQFRLFSLKIWAYISKFRLCFSGLLNINLQFWKSKNCGRNKNSKIKFKFFIFWFWRKKWNRTEKKQLQDVNLALQEKVRN